MNFFKSIISKFRILFASADRTDIVACFFSLLLAGFMMYASRLWMRLECPGLDFPVFPSKRVFCLLVFFIPSAYIICKRKVCAPGKFERVGLALFAGLTLYLVSCGSAHPWFFIFKWFDRGILPFHISSAEIAVFTSALILPAFLIFKPRKLVPVTLLLLLVIFQVYAFVSLIHSSGGAALYRDDHPSFMFRLHEFAQTYPAMTDFNPWWNAGVVNSVGSSSGIGSVAIPFYFFWKYLPVHVCYTPLVGILFIFVMPLLMLAGLRAIRASWTISLTGAIFALGASRWFFVWMLHFGTIGSSFSMAFLPLFALLAYRTCIMRKAGWGTIAGLVISGFFMAQWPPCLMMVLFFGIGWLLNIRRFRVAPHLKLLAAGVVIALLLLPNIIAVLDNRELLGFVSANQSGSNGSAVSSGLSFGQLLSVVVSTLAHRFPEVNPLVLVFGVAGAFFMPHKHLRRWFAPAIIGLLLFSAFGPLVAKRLQLERMALPAFIISVVPAAVFCGRILKSGSSWLAVPRSVVFVIMILGAASVAFLYKGYGYSPYSVMPRGIMAFAQCVRKNVPADGRLLFFERSGHAYGGGHIAYLPLLSQREMMGNDYYEFPPGMPGFSAFYPPAPWRNTAEGIASFMNLHGATHLALRNAHGRYEYIRDSGLFEEIDFRSGFKTECTAFNRVCDEAKLTTGLHLFALKDSHPGRFHEGTGTTSADCGYLRVSVTSADNRAVLRYVWSPLLTVDGGAEIYPVEVADGITFIGIKTADDKPVTIRYGGFASEDR